MPPFATTFNREDVAANQALVSPTLNSSQLASNTPSLTLPDLNQTDPRELQGVISSIPTVDQLIQASNAPSALETEQQDVRSAIERSLGILGTQDERLAEEQAARGIPEQTQQLQDITGRLRQLQAESLAIPLQIQEEFTGRGATRGGVEPIQTSRLRQNAIQSLTLGAQAQALQGNIALAEQQAAKAVELEFAPEKARLDFFKRLYEYNREDLERLDKKRADALRLQIGERDRLLQNAEVERKSVLNTATTIAQYGAPPSVVDSVSKARSLDEAIRIASPYMQDPAAKYQLQKIKYDALKSQLEYQEALSKVGGNETPLTGNVITDVANVIASNKIGESTKTLLGTIIGVQSSLEDFAKSAKPIKDKQGRITGYSIEGVTGFRAITDAKIPFTNTNIIPFRDVFKTDGGVKADAYINGINLKIQQWASGAALTEEQTRQVAEMTPRTSDSDAVAIKKVNALYDFMNQQIRGALIGQGIDFPIPESVDVFASQDSLEGIFGEE